MPFEFKITRRVEFAETDMAGIMHFSNFFRYMEYAEHAFFRSLGFSINTHDLGVGWPRVGTSCEFKMPLQFEDEVEIHLLVKEKKERAIGYTFVFRKDGQEVARGQMITVCVSRDEETGTMSATTIPSEIADQIEEAPAELLEQVQ